MEVQASSSDAPEVKKEKSSLKISADIQQKRPSLQKKGSSLANPEDEIDLSEFQQSHTYHGAPPVPEHLLLSNQVNSSENVSLFHAALDGNLGDVTTAILKGAKPNYFFNPHDSKCALHVAAEKGFTDIVEYLLENGAVPDARMASTKSTAIILAATAGQTKSVSLLIGAGANVNAANCYGNRALHEAAAYGHEPIINDLIAAQADINAANKKGSTPLHFFCYGDKPEVFTVDKCRILLNAGADVTWRDGNGYTPLLVCCTTGRLDLIQLLMEYGADPTVQDNNNRNAHAIATFYQKSEVAAYFEKDNPYSRF